MGRRIVILGGGESGTGAAVLACREGFDVFVSDSGTIKPSYRKELEELGVEWEEGRHSEEILAGAGELIISPGIPFSAPFVINAKKRGIPVISEIEFASRYTQAVKVGITGSNGKTTTASLLHHMIQKGGMNAGLAGNIGKSFARMVAEKVHEVCIIELSSFQLEGITGFRPDIAVLLNITPDHMDRYDNDLGRYAGAKFMITENQVREDAFVWCGDDAVTAGEINRRNIVARKYSFSIEKKEGQSAYIENGRMIISTPNNTIEMTLEELSLKGRHNIYNSMAAGIAGQLLRIRKEVIRDSLSDFQGIEHRLEPVLRVHGIDFVNDSKATNVNSSWYALESMTRKVVWIAGGIDKGNDYSQLTDLAGDKVRALICLGKDNSRLLDTFRDVVPTVVEAASMEEAVRSAYYLAKNGDTVLLSPACASFDLFENFEDRGRQFKSCVKNL